MCLFFLHKIMKNFKKMDFKKNEHNINLERSPSKYKILMFLLYNEGKNQPRIGINLERTESQIRCSLSKFRMFNVPFPFGVESILFWVPFSVKSILCWVPFWFQSIRGWVPFGVESILCSVPILSLVHSQFSPFWVQSILSSVHSGLSTFGVESIRG
jgi:hypothetical protein